MPQDAFKDPAFICAYGPPKMGKTTDMLFSFPHGLFIAAPGALKPSRHVVGYEPANAEAEDLDAATKIIEENGKTGKYDAVVVDDMSHLAERSVAKMQKSLSGFDLWRAVRTKMLRLRDAARFSGMHIAINAHEMAARSVNGRTIKGGPSLPGKMAEDLPSACDLVLRAVLDASRKGWHGVYRCNVDDAGYVTGDRHGVTPDYAPMNLAEILREAGYNVRRAPGMEWAEEMVERLTGMLIVDGKPVDDLAYNGYRDAFIEAMRAKGRDDLQIRWVLRDALDRRSLRLARKEIFSAF